MEIENVKNRVFEADHFERGKNIPYALHTNDNAIYKSTGFGQLADIVNTGFVIPKKRKIKRNYKREVKWLIGNDKFYYYDKKPVIEIDKSLLKDEQIGAVSIADLSSVWIYYGKEKAYVNRLEIIKGMYAFIKNNKMTLTKKGLIKLFNKTKPEKESEELES